MADRARDAVTHVLRVSRIGLRDHKAIHDRQLRFRTGIAYAFSNGLAGWQSRDDIAYDLALTHQTIEATGLRPVWSMSAAPVTDVGKKAEVAASWMERARFTGDPLVALLYLFFALEALLGDKAEGLKADAIAFRQLALSHIVSGGFRHPNRTWFLYDQIRSAAVHGEQAPDVDDQTVRDLEWSVRDTLNEYLAFATENEFGRRGKLVNAIESHPDIPQLAEWVRTHAGADWQHYLARFV